MRKIVKRAFMFKTFDRREPVRIEEGNLISYEFYNNTNNIKITIHNSDGDTTLDGPTLYLTDYIRDVEYKDLVHPEEYIHAEEQEDERKYTQAKQDKANHDKRINTAAVLNYFYEITKSEDAMDNRVFDWISSEINRLKGEMKRLDILTASDEDIIQTALIEYSNQERYNNNTEIANKITDVRNRYLEMIYPKEKGE